MVFFVVAPVVMIVMQVVSFMSLVCPRYLTTVMFLLWYVNNVSHTTRSVFVWFESFDHRQTFFVFRSSFLCTRYYISVCSFTDDDVAFFTPYFLVEFVVTRVVCLCLLKICLPHIIIIIIIITYLPFVLHC